jgi:pimeloyl-ACP methyl ester carboxylesterase
MPGATARGKAAEPRRARASSRPARCPISRRFAPPNGSHLHRLCLGSAYSLVESFTSERHAMADDRIHRAVSSDGTQIAGRVHGQGPPLVLVHGRAHDGDIAWEAMLPYLTDRFTCYLPSTRGRGLSAVSPDHSPPRLQEDFNTFVGSVGDPVFLAGWSTGGPWALGAAAHNASVAAVAVYEPTVIPVMQEGERASLRAMAEQMGVAAGTGRLVDAARSFHAWLGTIPRSPPGSRLSGAMCSRRPGDGPIDPAKRVLPGVPGD